MRRHASCLRGNREKVYVVLMEKTFFYFQDTNGVETQHGIGAKKPNVTKNFPYMSYSNAKREYVRNTLFSRNSELQQKDVKLN